MDLKLVLKSKFLLIAITITAVLAVVIAALTIKSKSSSYGRAKAITEAPSGPLKDSDAEVKAALPLFYRLNKDYVRGSEPAHGGISALSRLGVKTLIDLRSVYDHTDKIGVSAGVAGLRYHWLPMSVWNPPADKEVKKFLALVTNESEGPFYVFCADGIHRTGEMSAIYRIVHDNWSVEQALKEMDELGFNPFYSSLRNYVWTYARKYHPSAVPPSGRRLTAFEK
jgi:hypothetical protein